jgi:hypothetical protein
MTPDRAERRSRAWLLIVVLLTSVVFGWTHAGPADAGQPAASIDLAKTVGTDPEVCATDDQITVGAGTEVVYCYEVTNTGLTTLTQHDLVDSELGGILTDFPFVLVPGASAFLTQAGGVLADDTTNVATWTASDPQTQASASATASATVEVEPPTISLAKTVGTDPDVCATQDEISVGAGTEVVYCYEVTNTGLNTLTRHDLVDSELGDLLTDFPFVLVPGASAFLTQAGGAIDTTTTNNATWTARDPELGLAATATDSATVNVVVPAISLDKTVGTDPDVCATQDEITVGPGTEVVYCYEVTNTGLVTLNRHDLVDSELGSLLNDFPFTLVPGASAFLTQAGGAIDTTTTNTATWTARDPELGLSATATDSATVNVPVAGLSLIKTVGTDASACATDDQITVQVGTEVTYCYTATNTGDATLTVHDLVDSELGDLLTDLSFDLGPSASTFVTASATIDADTTNTATWTATDPELGLTAAASAAATVETTPLPTTTTTTSTPSTTTTVAPTTVAPTSTGPPPGDVASNVAARGTSTLPVTGRDATTVAWLGLVLVVLGVAALGVASRRPWSRTPR